MKSWTPIFRFFAVCFKMVKVLSFIGFLWINLIGNIVFGQDPLKLDSLLEQLRISNEDTLTIKTNIELGNLYSNPSLQTSSAYFKNALSLAKTIKANSLAADASYLLGANDVRLGLLDEGEVLLLDALEFYKYEGDSNKIALIRNNLGRVAYKRRDYKKAKEIYFEALKMADELEDRGLMATIYNNIGLVYWRLQDLERALDELKMSLEIRIELEDEKGKGQNYNNIGLIYYELKAYNNALEYFLKALNIAEKTYNKSLIITAHCNLGEIYTLLGNYKSSEKYYQKGIEFAKSMQNTERESLTWIHMAKSYIIQKKYHKSIHAGLKGLRLAETINFQSYQKNAYKSLIKANELLNNYKEALTFHKLYKKLNDQSLKDANGLKMAEVQNSIKIFKEKSERSIFQKETEIKNLEEKYRANFNMALIFSFVFVLILGFIMYMKVHVKTRGEISL